MTLTLAPPVAVGRRSGYYWFPTLLRLSDDALLVAAWDDLDAHTGYPMGFYNWSEDGGHTWTDPLLCRAPFSECAVALQNGDHLLLPYRLLPDEGNGLRGNASLVSRGQREILSLTQELRVTGFPRLPEIHDETQTARFSFNGQTVYLPDDGFYLTTLYGNFVGEERKSLVFAKSVDGLNWSVRSVLGWADCYLPGGEGPCEATLTCLSDKRLMCVFRTDGNIANVYDPASETSATPYGMVYSSDAGQSWIKPEQMHRPLRYDTNELSLRLPGSVQPSLAVLNNGTIVLSGGRPGLFLWLSPHGTGKDWLEVDLLTHHNQHCAPDETIDSFINTSSYTEVVALPDGDLLVVYDRLPLGWRPIPNDSPVQCSIWVVRVSLTSA